PGGIVLPVGGLAGGGAILTGRAGDAPRAVASFGGRAGTAAGGPKAGGGIARCERLQGRRSGRPNGPLQRGGCQMAWMEKNQPRNDDLRRLRAEAKELLKIEDSPKQ